MRCSTSLMSNLSESLADWLLELLPGNSETDQQSRSLESTRLRNFATRPSIAWIPIVALVAAIGVSPTPAAQRHVPVYYVQGEHHQRQQSRAHDCGVEWEAVDSDPARHVPRVREDPPLVVDAVPRVAAVGISFCRRHRFPRIPRRTDLRRLAWLRASSRERRALDIQLRDGRDAGPSDRQVMSLRCAALLVRGATQLRMM